MHHHLLLNVPVHCANLSFEVVYAMDVWIEEPRTIVAHWLLIFITGMNRHRAKPGQLPNLNFLVDQYQHIPQTANAN
jgi:hypothetical protein